jgi:hypothetical protein
MRTTGTTGATCGRKRINGRGSNRVRQVGQGRPHEQLYGDDADARRFNRHIHLCLVLLYLHFGLVRANRLPGWMLYLTAPVLVVRWMLSMHALFHLRTARGGCLYAPAVFDPDAVVLWL